MLLLPWRVLSQLPPQLSVHWQAAPSCPRSAAFDSELSRLLGQTAQTIEPSRVDVRVSALASSGYRLALALEVAGGQSERVLELPNCSDVPHTAALLVATALESSRAHPSAPTVARAPDGQPRLDQGAPPAEKEAQRPAAQRIGSVQSFSLRLGALGDLGTLPGATAGPLAGVQWSLAEARIWIEGRYLWARARSDDDSRSVGKVDLFAGALGAAWLWKLGRFALGPLLEVELGALRGRAHGELARSHAGAFWGSAQLGALLERAWLDRVSLALSAQASLPWSRPQFGLSGEPAFYTTGHVAARLGLGVRVKLGFKKDGALGQ